MGIELSIKNCVKNMRNTLIVGFSTGRDSVCLVDILSKVYPPHKIIAVYVNHGLREETREEEKFALNFCDERHIACYIERVDVNKRVEETGESVEEAARNLRYEALRKWQNEYPYSYIVTAHHMNDQAETVLLNLIRGCSTKGLSGMGMFDNDRGIFRPLLGTSREDINRYISKHKLSYNEDSSNSNNCYTRNWVRNELIPMLQTKNPNIVSNLANTANSLASVNDYLSSQAFNTFTKYYDPSSNSLNATGVGIEQHALRVEVIKKYLEVTGGLKDISRKHIEAMEHLICAGGGKIIEVPRRKYIKRKGRIEVYEI